MKTTVLEYFAGAFPDHPLDWEEGAALQSMPADSKCGAYCMVVINAGDILYEVAYREALAEETYNIAEAVLQICLVHING